jgi:alkylation response protein AidB-like acyl-CoA dehydrogenase
VTAAGECAATTHGAQLRSWLAAHADRVDAYRQRAVGGLAAAVEHDRGLLRLLHEAGWSRWGWPVACGGLGGSAVLRAVLYDELAAAGLEIPEVFVILETLGPVLVEYAPFEVRPIRAANGRDEFAELFFDDVAVPREHLVGPVDGGWGVAMFLLQFERGMYAWQRQATLHRRLRQVAAAADGGGSVAVAALGAAYLAATALRARSRTTVHRLSAGERPGPEISIDKILLSRAEQATFDAARRLAWPRMALADDEAATTLREEWFYSRATSIFGGAVDVQRDIVAEHGLGLAGERRSGR